MNDFFSSLLISWEKPFASQTGAAGERCNLETRPQTEKQINGDFSAETAVINEFLFQPQQTRK
jgi:hypothetical protein